MVVKYTMTAEASTKAFWYRWRTSANYKLGVFAAGVIPAALIFSFAAAAIPHRLFVAALVAIVVEALSPLIFAAVIRQVSRRGSRVLIIDRDGLSTEVREGQWSVRWAVVRQIAVTSDYIFFLGSGVNSVAVPVNAFGDAAERDEFVRRARNYWALATGDESSRS
jgi:hypothetical protein